MSEMEKFVFLSEEEINEIAPNANALIRLVSGPFQGTIFGFGTVRISDNNGRKHITFDFSHITDEGLIYDETFINTVATILDRLLYIGELKNATNPDSEELAGE